ncbi:ImmA/IrrE family metallo-endopeptidase [Lysinibacillus sp. 54212]|uniref:ImmA/IrrE family metallo-endopeptidase n=1 Tax=Lysinibacillus sp. 54212 TaxID=3119829 RepID=UPI002FCBC5A7
MKQVWTYTESYVKEMYKKVGIFHSEQLDFRKIAQCLRINVFYWKESSQALFFKDRGYIMLDETLSPQQQWQDFCHELGHVLLHTGSQSRLPKSFVEYQEYKANHFMYHAAVPTFMLEEMNLKHKRNSLLLVQQKFNVTEEFALKRLDQYFNNLYVQWSQQIHMK